MQISVLQGFLMFFLSWLFLLGCAEKESVLEGTTEAVMRPVHLEDVAATAAFIAAAEVVVIGFFQDPEQPEVSEFLAMVQNIQDVPFGLCTSSSVLSHYNVTTNTITLFRMVDNKRQDLEIKDIDGIDANKLSRFVRINELRWVTEYNPMSVIGIFESAIQTHLLLFTEKSSPKHEERMERYQEAAELFKGKVLFVLVDVNVKDVDRVMSYFNLTKSQLPALAAFHKPDEEKEVLPLDEISLEAVKEFCNHFLQRKQVEENPEPEDKVSKEEL